MWELIPPHLQDIHFDLDGTQWSSEDIRQFGDVLLRYEGRFSKSKTDLGHCHTLPFKIEIQPGTALIASRPYRTNPVVASQVDSILDSYLAAGIIEHSTSQWASLLVIGENDMALFVLQWTISGLMLPVSWANGPFTVSMKFWML